jgi:hypothetical protein
MASSLGTSKVLSVSSLVCKSLLFNLGKAILSFNCHVFDSSDSFNCHVFAAQFTVYDCSTSSIGKQDNY